MALHTSWIPVLAAALTVALGLSPPSVRREKERRLASSQVESGAGLSLDLRREIPLEHPLSFPEDGGWLVRSVVAIHPNGNRAVVLVPGERKVTLRPRPVSGLSERSFTLGWLDLPTGQFSHRRDLAVSENEGFGFSIAPQGDLICAIAGQKVMILDERLSVIAWKDAEITDPVKEKRIANSCNFLENASSVLVGYSLPKGLRALPWEWRSSLMQWNWKDQTFKLFHWDTFLPDTLPVQENLVLTSRTLRDQWYLLRFEEVNPRTQEVSWAKEYEALLAAQLVRSNRLVFSVSNVTGFALGGTDSTKRVVNVNKLLGVKVKGPWDQSVGPATSDVYLPTNGRVVMWDRGSNQRESEFHVRALVLHWPLVISRDESWFAVRAVKFSKIADNWTLRWDFNQFVIFSLDGSKRRLYLSEKFGPDEAITGLAVSADDKTLLVTTSRRLLVYDVRAGEARR